MYNHVEHDCCYTSDFQYIPFAENCKKQRSINKNRHLRIANSILSHFTTKTLTKSYIAVN